MAAFQLMRTCRPSPSPAIFATFTSQTTMVSVKLKCISNAMGFNLENNISVGDGERKPTVIAKAAVTVNSVVTASTQINQGVEVATVVTIVRTAMVRRLLLVTRSRSRMSSIVQLFIEKAIIDCRFFTMFAVAGTLLGSVLCFVVL